MDFQCHKCIWYLGKLMCMAFPKKIPLDFVLNNKKHNKVVKGQKKDYVFDNIIKE